MAQTQVRTSGRSTKPADRQQPVLDLRTPAGRQLPY